MLRDILRFDIEDILDGKPKRFDALLDALKEKGYEIKHSKYLAVKPAKAARFIRLKSLGDAYTEEALIAVIAKPMTRKKRTTREEEQLPRVIALESFLRFAKNVEFN